MTPAALAWLAEFRRFITTERQLSAHTDSNYARDLAALVTFCDGQGLDEWNKLDSQHIRLFAARSHHSGLAPRSIQRRLSAVRSFFEFLARKTQDARDHVWQAERTGDGPAADEAREALAGSPQIVRNPAADVRAPKAGRTLPDTLDPDQMARLLELPAGDAWVTRDRALMELLYSSGLRLAELVNLDVPDLLSDRTVHVREGKGLKDRIVPVGTKAHEALEAWKLERAGIALPAERALFVGRNGLRIARRTVQKRVAYWARRQGLGVHVHPHLFRHSFATHLLESSGEIRGVQELLGHAGIGTTQIYTHLDFQHLARTYEAAHPRARKKPSGD